MNDNLYWVALVLMQSATILYLHLLWVPRPHHRRHHRAVTGFLMASKNLKVGGTDIASVIYKDAAGNVVPPTSVPAWTVDNSSVATVNAAADGMSAEITAVASGTAVITVTDSGDNIVLTGDVVITDTPVTGELTFA